MSEKSGEDLKKEYERRIEEARKDMGCMDMHCSGCPYNIPYSDACSLGEIIADEVMA